ncbi:hypothetical protein [Anoxybacteroides tepidamans]|uniref:hypothetical protein n=1 Tax=Anoxybacteroides tepidamans TaxID=265948 RepID=UPI0004870D3C|nr:hypothetical protein [Anoxybacillus tepidamans]
MQQQPAQQQSMQQQATMQQPPQVISTKDALYLTDMMSWNLLAMKKAHFFASQCQDPEVVAAIERAGQMHQRHYEQILRHLQSTNQSTTSLQ